MTIAELNEEAIFHIARKIEPCEARDAYLDGVCGGDRALRGRLDALLGADAAEDSFLEFAPLDEADETPAISEGAGTTIGPYKLLEPIGEGGMGVVFMAEQSQPVRRRVALKVIKPGMDTKQVVARFEAERQALALMDHPNIARVLDAGATESGRPYFVMELVRGVPITEYCDRERLSVADRLQLFVLVCRAVQHAHQKGVIHRDLKPSNVLVTLHDGVPVPKVIDFGIAKATGGPLTDKTLFTGFAQLVGTPLYMSPEQAELSGLDIDTRSDIYSLGVLLYELLTGTTPFRPETLRRAAFDEVRRILREEEPPTPSRRIDAPGETSTEASANRGSDPRKLARALRGEIDWIVMKALEKDRTRRYESVGDLAADVTRHLTDQPVLACPPSAWYRLAKYARRHRLAIALTSSAAAALFVAVVGLTAGLIILSRERSKAESRLALARRAADEMYTQVAEKWISQQPRLTAVQREFLEKARDFYDRLAAEAGTDPDVLEDALRARSRVAAIQAALGQHADAETSWRGLIARSSEVLAREPGSPGIRLSLAEARLQLAALLRKQGTPYEVDQERRIALSHGTITLQPSARPAQLTEADQQLRQARLDLAPLDGASLRDPNSLRMLAKAERMLSNELTLARRLDEAEAAVEAGMRIWTSLAASPGAAFEDRLGEARAYVSRGIQKMWWGGRNEEAEVAYRQASTRLDTLLNERPTDVEVRNALSTCLGNLGLILDWTERHDRAEEVHRRVLRIAEGLAENFPDLPTYRKDQGDTLLNLALCLSALGRTEEAGRAREESLAIRKGLAAQYPEVSEYEAEVQESLLDLASDRIIRGEPREAKGLLDEAIGRVRAELVKQPGRWAAESRLASALRNSAAVSLSLGDEDGARAAVEEWVDGLQRTLSETGSETIIAVIGEEQLSLEAEIRADASISPKRLDSESRVYRMSFRSLIEKAAARWTDDARGQYALADMLSLAPEGLRDPGLGLKLAEKANALRPGDSMGWQSLGWARFRAGDAKGCLESLGRQSSFARNGDFIAAMALWTLGDRARAREVFDRAAEWFAGYETRWNPSVYPPASMIRRARDEARALMRATPRPPGVEAKETPRAGYPPG